MHSSLHNPSTLHNPGAGGFGTVWQVNWKGKEALTRMLRPAADKPLTSQVAVKQLYMDKKNAVAGQRLHRSAPPTTLFVPQGISFGK